MNSIKINEKNEFYQRKKICPSQKFCICTDVYRIYQGNNFDKISKALSNFEKWKIKIKDEFEKNIKKWIKFLISKKINLLEKLKVKIKLSMIA